MIPTAAAELADAEAQLAEQQAMVDSLVIRRRGQAACSPRRLARQTARRRDPGPVERLAVGRAQSRRMDRPGHAAGRHRAAGRWIAWAGVDQADAPAVEAGQPVRVLLDEQPMTVYAGRVTQVSRRARDNRAARQLGAFAATGSENPTGADLRADRATTSSSSRSMRRRKRCSPAPAAR